MGSTDPESVRQRGTTITMDPIAVITGGAGGMGLATAKLLGRNHRIVIADLDRERLDDAVAELHGLGVDASSTVCDITDPASVDALLDRAEAGGHVRAVIHTAGVSPQMGDAEFDLPRQRRGHRQHHPVLSAPRRRGRRARECRLHRWSHEPWPAPAQARVPARPLSDLAACERKLVASTKVMPEGVRPGLAYTTSKAFVLWYCRRMAQAFGAQGARILSVSPGTFDTAMGRLEEKSGSGDLVGYSALKRSGDPDEIASVLAFAASEAPACSTGTDILVDGGTKAGLGLRGIIALALMMLTGLGNTRRKCLKGQPCDAIDLHRNAGSSGRERRKRSRESSTARLSTSVSAGSAGRSAWSGPGTSADGSFPRSARARLALAPVGVQGAGEVPPFDSFMTLTNGQSSRHSSGDSMGTRLPNVGWPHRQ